MSIPWCPLISKSTDSQYVTLDHKTSHKGQFFKIEIYTSSESWINKLSIDVWFVMIYLESEGAKNKNIFMEHDLYLMS